MIDKMQCSISVGQAINLCCPDYSNTEKPKLNKKKILSVATQILEIQQEAYNTFVGKAINPIDAIDKEKAIKKTYPGVKVEEKEAVEDVIDTTEDDLDDLDEIEDLAEPVETEAVKAPKKKAAAPKKEEVIEVKPEEKVSMEELDELDELDDM